MPLSDYRKYRLLEMVPGLLVWTTFGLIIFLSFFKPLWAITFIILFDLYWLLRVLYMLTYTILVFRRYYTDRRIDWKARLLALPGWERMTHLVVLPMVNEPIDVLEATLKGLVHSSFPSEKMIVVIALEEKYAPHEQPDVNRLMERYRSRFRHIFTSVHPVGLPGEISGKGANTAWAGRKAKEYIDAQPIPYDSVIVSSFDIDTVVSEHYFSYVIVRYLTVDNPTRASYQPIPLFNNNIWDVPAFMRVVSNGTTFWLMSEQLRPERMFTFSSHSMSFQTLVDVDFWQNDIVTEDSRIFLQGLFRYDGDYRIEPLYIDVSMDAVHGASLWEGLINLYKQQRRWAWGVEHFPYMMWNFPKSGISLYQKWRYTWTLIEGMYSWATAPIIIFVMGHLPLYVAGQDVLETAVGQSAPYVLRGLMITAMVGLLFAAFFSVMLLPPRPRHRSPARFLLMLGQWILFPITMITFGSIPATEAQTRLMLGKYLGFNVTKKVRLASYEATADK